jgi:uncharacterized protein (TIGR03085 family)
MIVRERDPRGGPGIVLGGRFAEYTEKLMARTEAKGYAWMITRLREGPPWHMRMVPGADVNENFIHHEDVRRANGQGPRPPDAELDAVLLGLTTRMGKFATRRLKGYGIELQLPGDATHPDGQRVVLRTGDQGTAVLAGPVGETVLYLAGRRGAARVALEGDASAVDALRVAKLGI